MEFYAIDVETANASRSSICQLGLVHVLDGQVTSVWSQIVDPGCRFDAFNVAIHGISQRDVDGKPSLRRGLAELVDRLGCGATLVSHTGFDRVAIERAASEAALALPPVRWLDSAKVARRTWAAECGKSGFGLKSVCRLLNISFAHHDAAEDARAAALIVVRAGQHLGLDIEGLHNLTRATHVVDGIKGVGDPTGEWAGNCIAFTGSLEIPRREAAKLAAALGFDVSENVSKKVTHLVLGDRDAELYSKEKSGKHLKAEQLIGSGHPLQLISESDFQLLVLTAGLQQS